MKLFSTSNFDLKSERAEKKIKVNYAYRKMEDRSGKRVGACQDIKVWLKNMCKALFLLKLYWQNV